jgi:hypothetical protein
LREGKSQEGKSLLFVNKKKQKNFLSSPVSTLERARWRATGPKGKKFLGAFPARRLQKGTACLALLDLSTGVAIRAKIFLRLLPSDADR